MFTFNNKWFSLDYSIPLGKKRDFNSFYRELLSALKTEFVIKKSSFSSTSIQTFEFFETNRPTKIYSESNL